MPKRTSTNFQADQPEEIELAGSKLKSLSIRNFRCIGDTPVLVELDDIVVLVGANNVGKSTILRAFEVAMEFGSKEGGLTLADFPNGEIQVDRTTEIILETYVQQGFPAAKWLHRDDSGQTYVRERFRWDGPGAGKRQGQLAGVQDEWDESVPWGAPNVASSRRPKPHRIDAFADPQKQSEQILNLLRDLLWNRALSSDENEEAESKASESKLALLKRTFTSIQKEVLDEARSEIARIEDRVGGFVGGLFPGYKVKFNARTDEVSDKDFKLFANASLEMGREGDYLSPIEAQGSGARRALLWGVLKSIGEEGKSSKTGTAKTKRPSDGKSQPQRRSNILLLDEPEICLHPNAIREACRVLYDMAQPENGWQVMITTHSPVFIDLSRDNTTVVRVQRSTKGDVTGTTLYRPTRAKLTTDDKEFLKLLNLWDPYVAEFFFGGTTILVEGDTEHCILKYLLEETTGFDKDVHIVRARGKAILVPLIKILNQFGSKYCVLHDSDYPYNDNGSKNAMWSENAKILEQVHLALPGRKAKLVCALENIEEAIFGDAGRIAKDKPFNAVSRLRADANLRAKATELLKYLLSDQSVDAVSADLPTGFADWDNLDELAMIVTRPEPQSGN